MKPSKLPASRRGVFRKGFIPEDVIPASAIEFLTMKKLQDTYKVVSNEKVCAKFYRLCLDAPPIVSQARPGQFIHIRINDGLEPFFRRPFSIYRAKKHVEILYEAVGRGTEALAAKAKGGLLDVLGPLGTPFTLPPKTVKHVVMIAGGVGVAPFLFLSDVLKAKGHDMTLLYGARTKGHVFKMDEFKNNGCKIFKATDDGSVGEKGRVSVLFPKIGPDAEKTFLYTCGPRPMMASVQEFARRHRIKGQASCEEVMACGLGACLGCSTKTTRGYKTVCGDGPAFDLDELIFGA
jgi:dihydroorotate dehydrogenase electron transfer subunit